MTHATERRKKSRVEKPAAPDGATTASAAAVEAAADAEKRMRGVWVKYKRQPSPGLRNQLMEHYLPLVQRCAQRLHAKLPATVQLEDLVSTGVFGLMDAIEAFELDRHVRFSTFSAIRIRGAILDELRAMDWVPRLVRTNAKKLEAATRQLETELGRGPSDEEIAGRLNLSPRSFSELSNDTRAVSVASLSGLRTGNSEGEEEGLSHPLPDTRAPDPVNESQRRALKDAVTTGLSRAERLLITLYYYENLTMREVGQVLDLSESRVSQMHTQIVKRLRATASAGGGTNLRELAA